ncbi:MAG: ChaN family lipoprotein [Candidatus Cloacimonadota bacterium]|nr:ChaN family lipoprotein [Candidatus Cloacimonadota bacterium]
MKNILLFSLTIFVLFLSVQADGFSEQEYKLYDSATGQALSLLEMADRLADYDVVFFGEYHDDALIHSIESEILPFLYAKRADMVISMEMFERDVQSVVDSFLTSQIAEDRFLQKSRAWPNYISDYKNIVDFAVKNNLDVIAANVPRKYAALINKKGISALDSIPENEKKFTAKELKVLNNDYKIKFIETMTANMKSGSSKRMPMMRNSFDKIYAAQCLKDDTMAESVFQYLQSNPEKFIIHYNGDFHSASHLGTANKLRLLDKNLKIAVISPVSIPEGEEINFVSDAKDQGDFLMILHRK